MAKNVADLIDELQLRLRDVTPVALTDAIAMRFLSYGVGYAALARQSTLIDFTLTSEINRQLYDLTETSERIVRVVRVSTQSGARDLTETTFGTLSRRKPRWFRDVGDQYQEFTQIGKRLLVLYPAIPRAESVTLHCRAVPVLYTNSVTDTTSDIADDLVPLALTIAETLLLIRERRHDRIPAQLDILKMYFDFPPKVQP